MRISRGHCSLNAVVVLLAALLSACVAGCSSKLETGYEPRKLGASDETRRGFYAQPFSPEAKAAKQYEQEFGDVHRPKPGY
jgi:hypothetical protein